MSEKDFWTKYCRAEYLNRTKNAVVAAAEAAEDEELAVFLKHDDILANEARRKVPRSRSFFFCVLLAPLVSFA
jgi:transcription initiation factor TFIIH subunit 1